MSGFLHTPHVVLAGVWLGGVVFTTLVVSPALKAMKWPESERVLVRSAIGKQYARVGSANLGLLLIFALLDGLAAGFGAAFYAGYVLLGVVFGLVAAHGAYFGRRLASLAEAEKSAENPEAARVTCRAAAGAGTPVGSGLAREPAGQCRDPGPRRERGVGMASAAGWCPVGLL